MQQLMPIQRNEFFGGDLESPVGADGRWMLHFILFYKLLFALTKAAHSFEI
jgi:hypothetical protein